MIDIQGKWKVTYKIEHPDNNENLKDKEFCFDIEINNNDGELSGKFKEIINNNLIEDNISGFIEDSIISFTRLYYPHHIIHGEINNRDNNNEESLGEMEFSGEYDPNLNEFTGEWHVILNIIQKGYFYFEEGFSGTWKMIKV